jgi:beta-carotene/zeaxanthin 4-ketolase
MASSRARDMRGLWIAAAIVITWAVSLGLLLSPLSDELPTWLWPLGTFWMTFLYTGLFITAHDAMHGSILRSHRQLNAWIGRVILFLYALFPYAKMRDQHFLHHRFPGQARDPDYHDGQATGWFRWYAHFMRHYLTVWQLLGMAFLFNLAQFGVGIPVGKLLVFWAAPALLSTVQLFTFGSYLPHREPAGGYTNRHHAQSNDYPVWLSLLTCYHFGYHLEHHEAPNIPWWQLPRVHSAAAAS